LITTPGYVRARRLQPERPAQETLNVGCEHGPVEQQTQPQERDTSRGDMAISFVISTLVNVGYILIAPADQRILLFLMFSIVGGMIMLVGEKSGPYGMGLILGAAAATAIAVGLALAGFSPHDFHPGH
jgi:hypothetical protein